MSKKTTEKQIFVCKIIIIIMIIVFLIAENLIGTVKVPIKGDNISKKTFEDARKKGVKIGVLLGTAVSKYLKKEFRNADIQLYNTNEDVYAAVDSGVIDFGIAYDDTVKKVASEYDNIMYIDKELYKTRNCFAMPKNEKGKKLCDEFNNYLREIKNNGTYEKLDKKWNTLDENNYKLEEYNITGVNGIINVVTGGTWIPKTFVYNNDLNGLFIDVLYGFCERYGYEPKLEVAAFAAELAGLASEKYDIMADIVEDTEERRENAYLTDSIIDVKHCFIVHETGSEFRTVSKKDIFFTGLKDSFYKTFIVNNRWEMFAWGLLITILLAIFSAFFGTILGSIICYFRMCKNPFFVAFAQIYIKIIQGTPIVVLLMVLNYIIFNKLGLAAFAVSVIGFTLDFAAYVSEIFRTGIEAVPEGQIKAAYALGFNKIQTFIKIVFPQALIYIIPVYSGQFISMVKLTSVAGYISVQDLTKISDYVRTLTYDAFFPLISTAIIYFLLASVLVSLLKILERKVDPNFRKRNIKGVKECL